MITGVWVLVIWYGFGPNSGKAIDHIEGFSSSKDCQAAASIIYKVDDTVKLACIVKGGQ
jgi:hypothetical protein